ncbi:MAG: metallophosphoesterase [Bacteroidales bacterium]|nr:metallophosphoesterase [Bacteroidales bacterium]
MYKFLKIITVLTLSAIILVAYAFIEPRWIKTKIVTIQSADIPENFDDFKIVFISDIHHGPYLSIERVAKLVKRINKLEPDIILLGGDYVHRDAKYIVPVFEELSKFQSKHGVFAVLGNHDHWEDANLTLQMMNQASFNVCNNNSFWLKIGKDSIKIGGVDDLWEGKQIIDSTISDVKQEDFCILISHSPDYVEEMNTNLVDLVVSGHTHGGQVTFFGLWAPIIPSKYGQKYRYGLKEIGNNNLYITSGIGTITPPVRFFCRPEIVVFKLKKD